MPGKKEYKQLLLFEEHTYNEMLSASIDNWECFVRATKNHSVQEKLYPSTVKGKKNIKNKDIWQADKTEETS